MVKPLSYPSILVYIRNIELVRKLHGKTREQIVQSYLCQLSYANVMLHVSMLTLHTLLHIFFLDLLSERLCLYASSENQAYGLLYL